MSQQDFRCCSCNKSQQHLRVRMCATIKSNKISVMGIGCDCALPQIFLTPLVDWVWDTCWCLAMRFQAEGEQGPFGSKNKLTWTAQDSEYHFCPIQENKNWLCCSTVIPMMHFGHILDVPWPKIILHEYL